MSRNGNGRKSFSSEDYWNNLAEGQKSAIAFAALERCCIEDRVKNGAAYSQMSSGEIINTDPKAWRTISIYLEKNN